MVSRALFGAEKQKIGALKQALCLCLAYVLHEDKILNMRVLILLLSPIWLPLAIFMAFVAAPVLIPVVAVVFGGGFFIFIIWALGKTALDHMSNDTQMRLAAIDRERYRFWDSLSEEEAEEARKASAISHDEFLKWHRKHDEKQKHPPKLFWTEALVVYGGRIDRLYEEHCPGIPMDIENVYGAGMRACAANPQITDAELAAVLVAHTNAIRKN